MSFNVKDRAAFIKAATALLAARERLELHHQQPGKTSPAMQAALQSTFHDALRIVAKICRKGNGVVALTFRLFYPAMWPDGSIDALHIILTDEVVDVDPAISADADIETDDGA